MENELARELHLLTAAHEQVLREAGLGDVAEQVNDLHHGRADIGTRVRLGEDHGGTGCGSDYSWIAHVSTVSESLQSLETLDRQGSGRSALTLP